MGRRTQHDVVAGRYAAAATAGIAANRVAPDIGVGTVTGSALSGRDRAILRAVENGTAELIVGVEPDLYLDGRWCADQFAAHRLARAGLIAPLGPAAVGRRVPARLTAAGRARLAA